MFQQSRLFAVDVIHPVDSLDEDPDIVLLAVFPASFRVGIRFPIAQVTCYALNYYLGTEGYDLG
jgi:hypothetical protein